MINLKNILVELEFKTPEEFADYKKKHKMRPGTVVKVAGKDKVVGGDDASKASPKKRFSDIPFTQADVGQIKQFAKDNNLDIKDMRRDPNGNLSVDFDGTDEDMEKALTSDFYGEDPQDAKDTIARGTEIGKDDESKPKETTPIENRPGETFGKNYKSVGDMMDSISQQKERVQLNIFDFDSMDQFNGALFIEDGKLMYPGLDGEPTEVNDQDTQMALFDLVKNGEVNVVRSEFRQGDRILLPKKIGSLYSSWGDVTEIGLRTTRVRSTDGVLLTVPNKLLTKDTIANFNHKDDMNLRVRIRLGLVPTWENVTKGEQIVEEIAKNNEDICQEKPKPPQSVLRDFGDQEVIMEIRYYVPNAPLMRSTKSYYVKEILRRFEEENVNLAYPTRLIMKDPEQTWKI